MPLSELDTHTGDVIFSKKPKTIDEQILKEKLNSDSIVSDVQEFLTEFRINSFLSIPLRLLSGEQCALNIYRSSGVEPFQENDFCKETAYQLTELLPHLYQALTDKVAYCLVDEINKLLQQSNIHKKKLSQANEDISVYKAVCQKIAKVLQVHETLLYLADNLNENKEFKLFDGIWPDPMQKDILKSYAAGNSNGLTGWILHNKQTVSIFDLDSYEHFRDKYHTLYPGLQWDTKRLVIVQNTVRQALKIPHNNDLPPLSFMGTPVMFAGELLGVIRCSSAQNAPYYFSKGKEGLLRLVADQIGQAWYNTLTQATINKENLAWHQLNDHVTQLNNTVLNESHPPKTTDVYEKILDTLSIAIPDSKISTVRLIDETDTYLRFVNTRGTFWNEGSKEDVLYKKKRTFPLVKNNTPPQSIGALVVNNAKAIVIHQNDQDINAQDADLYTDSLNFYKAKSIIVVPIISDNKVIGVLDVLATENQFPLYAKTAAALLGIQLGLFISFLKTNDALKMQRELQTLSYEDFNHQLKSPINQLYNRSTDIIDNYSINSDKEMLSKKLLYLRGLSARALRVSDTLRLFTDLSKGERIKPKKILLAESVLTRMLIENAIDQESLVQSDKNLKISVVKHEGSFVPRFRLEADIDLLKQAVSNLLDNATKYSFKGTKVFIGADVTSSGKNIHITVSNYGLPLTTENVTKCKSRGWRSDDAKMTTGEGSGIGLWIVDHIMKAHDGELIIIPTAKGGKTEVKLLFPVGR